MVDAALDPPPSALPMLVASSPKIAFSSIVDAALDPPSLVNLDLHADSFAHGHLTLLLVWPSLPSTLQSASFKDENHTPFTTIPVKE
eukprot:8740129-Ditylum_brightwellii.AAC.1